jgi:hypothetical protein
MIDDVKLSRVYRERRRKVMSYAQQFCTNGDVMVKV